MFEEEAIEKYGKRMWKKMCKSGWLSGITVTMKDGKMDIPESDIDRAYRHVKGEKIHHMDWD